MFDKEREEASGLLEAVLDFGHEHEAELKNAWEEKGVAFAIASLCAKGSQEEPKLLAAAKQVGEITQICFTLGWYMAIQKPVEVPEAFKKAFEEGDPK